MDLFKRIMGGKTFSQGGDKKQDVINLLGADPIEVLKKKIDEVNRMTSGSPLEIAATIYVMEGAIKSFKNANFREVTYLLDMFRTCLPELGAVCASINKKTGKTDVKKINLNKE